MDSPGVTWTSRGRIISSFWSDHPGIFKASQPNMYPSFSARIQVRKTAENMCAQHSSMSLCKWILQKTPLQSLKSHLGPIHNVSRNSVWVCFSNFESFNPDLSQAQTNLEAQRQTWRCRWRGDVTKKSLPIRSSWGWLLGFSCDFFGIVEICLWWWLYAITLNFE